MGVQTFRDSIAWQKAMDLSVAVYGVMRIFPKEELFGLMSQLRRASVSIASNIAEGQGRLTSGEFAHFIGSGLPLLPLGDRLLVDAMTPGQRPHALLTMLYRSTDRLCRCGAPV